MSNRRYMVYLQSGRKFMVEEYGEPYVKWGNVIPGQDKMELVHCKMDEPIGDHNTQITKDNGYKNIVMLDMGTSPLGYIEAIDKSGVERFEKLDCGEYLLAMEKSAKIIDGFFYTTTNGWSYKLDNDKFRPGDRITDGDDIYTVGQKEPFKYPHIPDGVMYGIIGINTVDCWVYYIDKNIPNAKGKELTIAP